MEQDEVEKNEQKKKERDEEIYSSSSLTLLRQKARDIYLILKSY